MRGKLVPQPAEPLSGYLTWRGHDLKTSASRQAVPFVELTRAVARGFGVAKQGRVVPVRAWPAAARVFCAVDESFSRQAKVLETFDQRGETVLHAQRNPEGFRIGRWHTRWRRQPNKTPW